MKEIESGQINIGGFNVPVNSLLKRARGEPGEFGQEAQILQKHLLTTQKWLIYWIVYATCSVIEKVLFLSYVIPLYYMLRLGFSVWLLSPMFWETTISEGQTFDQNKDWASFTENGAGLVYFKYLKPWLDGELVFLSKFPLDFNDVKRYLMYIRPSLLLQFLNYGQNQTSNMSANNVGSLFATAKSYFYSGESTTTNIEPKEVIDTAEPDLSEEYDVIDSPDNTSEAAKRKVPEGVQKRSSWLW